MVKFVLARLHINAGRDVVDTSLLALVLSFACKAGIGKGNDRKIVPINPISLESDLEVTSDPCKASSTTLFASFRLWTVLLEWQHR